jgi:hypothetical protein
MLVACGVLLASRPSAQKAEHVLDLTGVPSVEGVLVPSEVGDVPIDKRLGFGVVALSLHGPRVPSPFTFRVTLLGLDAASYSPRDPFFYEVRLVNIGGDSVSFPWTLDNSLFPGAIPDSRVVRLGLGDANDARAFAELGAVNLYGAPDVPGSLERIEPGESVRMRVRSDWMIFQGGEKQLRVVVSPSLRGLALPRVNSENVVVVQAREPLR